MTKNGRQFFEGKIGVTLLVASPGDTNLSDVTAYCFLLLLIMMTMTMVIT